MTVSQIFVSSPGLIFFYLSCRHQTNANAVERTANEALSDSEKGLALVRTLMNKENKVKELIGDLKTTWVSLNSLSIYVVHEATYILVVQTSLGAFYCGKLFCLQYLVWLKDLADSWMSPVVGWDSKLLMSVFRYDQTSAQVKGLENQASRVSAEAKDESKMAENMLKGIASMEQSIPSSLKVTANSRFSQDLLQKLIL